MFTSIVLILTDHACSHIRSKTKTPTKKPENEDNDNEENDFTDIKAQRYAQCSAMKTKVAGGTCFRQQRINTYMMQQNNW